MIKRQQVRWFHTRISKWTTKDMESTRNAAVSLLRFSQESFLLTSTPGNVSAVHSVVPGLRCDALFDLLGKECEFFVTPRQVDKSKVLGGGSLIVRRFSLGNCCRLAARWRKGGSAVGPIQNPSTRAPLTAVGTLGKLRGVGVQSCVYVQMPHIRSFLHFHYGDGTIVLPMNCTRFPYPCGCIEEVGCEVSHRRRGPRSFIAFRKRTRRAPTTANPRFASS
jgi:hypothetical protein